MFSEISLLAAGLLIGVQASNVTASPVVVIVTRASGGKEPALGARLRSDSIVSLPKGAKRTLLHLPTGKRLEITGPCEYLVQSKGLTWKKGEKGTSLKPVAKLEKKTLPKAHEGKTGFSRPGAILTRGDDDPELGPIGVGPFGALLPNETTVNWKGFIDGDTLSVSITNESTEVGSFRLPNTATSLEIPASARTPGRLYLLTMTVLQDGRFRNSTAVSYRFLTSEEVLELLELERTFLMAAEQGETEAIVLLCDRYLDLGLTAKAKHLLPKLKEDQLSLEEFTWLSEAKKLITADK